MKPYKRQFVLSGPTSIDARVQMALDCADEGVEDIRRLVQTDLLALVDDDSAIDVDVLDAAMEAVKTEWETVHRPAIEAEITEFLSRYPIPGGVN